MTAADPSRRDVDDLRAMLAETLHALPAEHELLRRRAGKLLDRTDPGPGRWVGRRRRDAADES